MSECPPTACETCPAHHTGNLVKLGIDMERYDWAETLIDALSPESRIELASGLAQNSS